MQESLYLEFDPDIAEDLIRFFAHSKVMAFKKVEIISRSDSLSDRVFCSRDGCVVAYSLTLDGNHDIHTFTRPKTVFPLTDVFTPKIADTYLPSRTKYFEAMTDMHVWHVPAKAFSQYLLDNPAAQQALVRQICLNHRVHITRLEMMQLRNLEMRVIAFLLILALLVGKPEENRSNITISVSHQLVAASLSIARETASRELLKLKKLGLIQYQDHRLVLPDISRLKQIIEDY